jgi:hypothetical protein
MKGLDKRPWSSCGKYLNKGYSYDAVTRIGRLAVGQTILLPEATVGLVPTNAHVFTDTVSLGRKIGYS